MFGSDGSAEKDNESRTDPGGRLSAEYGFFKGSVGSQYVLKEQRAMRYGIDWSPWFSG